MAGIQNLIVAVMGRKGTGKSELLYKRYIATAPRVLELSMLEQDLSRDPNVIRALGFGRLMDALKQAAHYERWHIATELEPGDMVKLATMLCPPMGSTKKSLSEALGGIALASGECYQVFPNGRAADEVLALVRRGRHYKLDLFMATQRPAACSRDITSAADHIYCFQQSEPADVDFVAKTVSKVVARRLPRLGEHEYIRYERGKLAEHFNAAGRCVASIQPFEDPAGRSESGATRSLAG